MDSIAIAYWKRPTIAITIDYGQIPAEAELRAARATCSALNIPHDVVQVDCRSIGSGDLAGTAPLTVAPVPEWWPYRNQLLVTLGASRALVSGAQVVILGTVRSDGTHADGTLAFVERMSAVLAIQEGGLTLSAPAAHMSTAELVRAALIPFEILAWAHSCHTSNLACGRCRGCAKHFEATAELGLAPY
jgi:7-cyano-7-deazaguanine synthase